MDLFITTNFQTVVRGAQGHPTGNMISRFVPWPMNYSFLVSNTRKVIRLSVTKLQIHLTPPPAGRQLDWGDGCSTGTLPFKDKEKRTVTYWLSEIGMHCLSNVRTSNFSCANNKFAKIYHERFDYHEKLGLYFKDCCPDKERATPESSPSQASPAPPFLSPACFVWANISVPCKPQLSFKLFGQWLLNTGQMANILFLIEICSKSYM